MFIYSQEITFLFANKTIALILIHSLGELNEKYRKYFKKEIY
ncbi:uncharacterized protein METZ01_LOCUS85561 [marine metagenome]|uniref:Uncharacterized protein n=1 Tax=marine metagenome TaxID=408172 RepID=A0A381UZA0_9ZZZZ